MIFMANIFYSFIICTIKDIISNIKLKIYLNYIILYDTN